MATRLSGHTFRFQLIPKSCVSFRRLDAAKPAGNFLPPYKHSRNRNIPVRTEHFKWALRLSLVEQRPRSSTLDVNKLVDFLYEDLPHLFDDQGIDRTMYDEQVKFRDPITKHDTISGYLFNIDFLKRLFRPDFQLHYAKQTGPYEITTRWTMIMKFILLPWKPELVFTGISIMGINPETQKFCSHLDLWDSITKNEYFSLEGLWDVIQQLRIYKTPDLETPRYQILKRTADYEVRKYSPFVVAETKGDNLSGSRGFNDVAGYIFGKNSSEEKIPMTTPVFTQAFDNGLSNISIQIVLPLEKDLSSLPDPSSETVSLRNVEGGIAAVLKFSGKPTEDKVSEKEKVLRSALLNDGLKPREGCLLARYNDPGRTWSFIMEVLVGKCNVVCVSKDERSPQPSEVELQMADYIFYRTFDVGKFTISDKIGDKIAGIEVRYFFNRKQGRNVISVPKINENWKTKCLDNTPELYSKPISVEAGDRTGDNGKPGCVAVPTAKGDKMISRPKRVFYNDGVGEDKFHMSQIHKKSRQRSDHDSKQLASIESISFKKGCNVENLCKPSERVDIIVTSAAVLRKEGSANVVQHRIVGSDGDPGKSSRLPLSVKDSGRQNKDQLKTVIPHEKASKLSVDAGKGLARDKSTRTDERLLDVTRRPDDERSKWFKLNLDPCYTSSEVEDIIWSSFKKKCTAKMVPQSAFASPHNGQAHAIFESREVAEMVIAKLYKSCLMLPNGRPLIARKGIHKAPQELKKIIGHLSVDNMDHHRERAEMRNAVSTSHFPQPNTTEYEMAVEWCLLHKRSSHWWEALYEGHGRELNELRSKLKSQVGFDTSDVDKLLHSSCVLFKGK